MASSIFDGRSGPSDNGIFAKVDALRQMAGGNPDAMMQQMMRTNPQFAEFVNNNRGKTPEQIASEYGLDYNLISKFL